MKTISGKTAFVTGAASGIGVALSKRFVKAGANVMMADNNADALAKAQSELGGNTDHVVCNVADPESVRAAATATLDRFGKVHIIVNNAGITRDNLMLRMKEEEWSDIMTTNLTSVFRLSKACLKGMMKARHGRIISISSVVGATGNAGQANYAAAKAGVVGFSKSLAQEIGSRGITVNVVAPGFIDTDMTRELAEDQRAKLMTNIPLGKLGEAEDIANAVLFLASDMGSYISGETLHVNGGMYMS